MLRFEHQTDGRLELVWCRAPLRPAVARGALTEHELRLLGAIGDVLAARFRSLFLRRAGRRHAASFSRPRRGSLRFRLPGSTALSRHQRRGSAETDADRRAPSRCCAKARCITYENRRISTGVLLMGPPRIHMHPRPDAPPEALPYNRELIGVKSFHRLCDGIKTVFLVRHAGCWSI